MGEDQLCHRNGGGCRCVEDLDAPTACKFDIDIIHAYPCPCNKLKLGTGFDQVRPDLSGRSNHNSFIVREFLKQLCLWYLGGDDLVSCGFQKVLPGAIDAVVCEDFHEVGRFFGRKRGAPRRIVGEGEANGVLR